MLQLSVATRNAMLDAFETAVGASAVLKIFTGVVPADCAAADSGTELVSMTLPADWLAAAASGSKSLLGSWSGMAGATGTAAHFRIYASDGTTCHMQGTVSQTDGGGDLQLDSVIISSGQTVNVTAFTLTGGNA